MEISLAAEKIGNIFGMEVSNSFLMTIMVSVFLIVFAIVVSKKLKLVPGKLQNFTELLIESFFSFIISIVGSAKEAKKFFPLVASFFIFILISNWLGIFPGVGTIGFYESGEHGKIFVPFFRSGNADLNTTLALAVVSVFATQIFGIAAIGFFRHFKKYFSLKGPIDFFVGILELVSEAAKIVSFSFRLFGNIFAGEVLLVVVGFLIPFILPLPFMALELFVGFIQALVFSMLTLVFLKIATTTH